MKRTLPLILVVAAALRLGLLAAAWDDPQRFMTSDSQGYVELSDSLASDFSFQRGGNPEIFRTPGYPLFLLITVPFGRYWAQGAVVVQIACDVLLVYLTYLLGWMLWGRGAGLWAAALAAVSAVAIASSVRILTDGLFAMLGMMVVLLLVHHFRLPRWWSLIGAAALAAAACYIRPVGQLYCFAAVLVLLGGRRWRQAAAFGGVALLALGPWLMRNYVVADYVGLSSVAGHTAFKFHAPTVLAEVEDISAEQGQEEMKIRLMREVGAAELSAGALARSERRMGAEVLLDHSKVYMRQHARGCLAVWAPGVLDVLEILAVTGPERGTSEVLAGEGVAAGVKHYFRGRWSVLWLWAPAAVVLMVKYALVLLCAARSVRLRMDLSRWLILILVLGFALVPGVVGHPRFRVPIAPLLSVCAGAGAAGLIAIANNVFRLRRPFRPPRGRALP